MQLEVKINLILHATENEKKVFEELENNFQIEQSEFQVEEALKDWSKKKNSDIKPKKPAKRNVKTEGEDIWVKDK